MGHRFLLVVQPPLAGPTARCAVFFASPAVPPHNSRPRPKVQNEETRMSDLKAKFEAAVATSKNLPERPDNASLLKLYALYKQATSGDVDGKRPGFTDMVGRAKWDAWSEIKGTSSNDAMKQYVALIDDLKG
jgi:diazepam-binding inhibitor (GABA receptor modulator, acyl-CoA-binding protein)